MGCGAWAIGGEHDGNTEGVRKFKPRATPWVNNRQSDKNSERVRERIHKSKELLPTAHSLSRLWTHLIFSTKDRFPFLTDEQIRQDMLAYLATVLRSVPTDSRRMTQVDSFNRSRPPAFFIHVHNRSTDAHFTFRVIGLATDR